MRSFLHIDEETRELRLVITDLASRHHERTEFRVVGSDGRPLAGVERWGHLDGCLAASIRTGQGFRYYIAPRASVPPELAYESDRVYLDIQEPAVGVTERIACRRAVNRRYRCAVCDADNRAGRRTGER